MFQPRRIELAALDAAARAQLLRRAEDELADYLGPAQAIIDRVRTEGDAALVHYAREFDGADLQPDKLLAAAADFERAEAELDAEIKATLQYAAANIRAFHQTQVPAEMQRDFEPRPGVALTERTAPITSVACYCPRGKGSFPSVALMTLIPAVLAQVPTIVLLTPPAADGGIDTATLYAAKLAGVDKVAKAGGVQAVAAAAFGTVSIPRCHQIEGPGSPWLAAAKRLLAGQIDARLPAGPSESVILADASSTMRLCALDMLIESEHGDDSSVYLVTDSASLADEVSKLLDGMLGQMEAERRSCCEAVLNGPRGGIIVAPDMDAACSFVNDYAPEHLQIMGSKPDQYLSQIHAAAEILLGEQLPGSIANYVLGPNCVLPTGGAARTRGPLSVRDFLKTSTVAKIEASAYPELAAHTRRFAKYEGFDGHGKAVAPDRLDAKD